MANKPDSTSLFSIVAVVLALALVAAAALVVLRPDTPPAATEGPAALAQAIGKRAEQALAGQRDFDALARGLARLDELRQDPATAAAGSPADWDRLQSSAAAILEKRAAVAARSEAATGIAATTAALMELTNEILDRSGATAIVQEFQQRSAALAATAARLARGDMAAAAGSVEMADDYAFLADVARGLGGGETSLDVSPLADAGPLLAALEQRLAELQSNIDAIGASAREIEAVGEARAAVSASADALLDAALASSAAPSAEAGFAQGRWVALALIIVALLLLAGLVWLNSDIAVFERRAREQAAQNDRNQQAILRLLDEMGSLADGDLTVEATVTEDITGTIADSFNYAIEELRKLVTAVNETAIMVDSAAKQTENTAAHMARAAENQTREIAAATDSIVSMAASIEEVSGNAERSSDVARHSVDVAHKGGVAVRRTIDGMNTIRETIQETSKRIKRLGESSQEIGNIVELINDIAEQTNILALNASIQASMAGEAGRGFAVVADEVQRLAERSTNATRQIEVLVSTIQADTKEAVVSMERSTTDVVGGALLAENAGAALDEIEQVSNQIASLVQNISTSARHQAGSAADVTRRTKRLSEISEQTGKATTATAAAISKLSEFASQLRQSVEGFTLPHESRPATELRPPIAAEAIDEKTHRPTGTG